MRPLVFSQLYLTLRESAFVRSLRDTSLLTRVMGQRWASYPSWVKEIPAQLEDPSWKVMVTWKKLSFGMIRGEQKSQSSEDIKEAPGSREGSPKGPMEVESEKLIKDLSVSTSSH